MNIESLHDRLAKRRKELGLTQQEVATLVQVSSTSVYKWENGQAQPKGNSLFSLSRALKCSPTWLLYGDDDLKPISVEELPKELDDRQLRMLELFDSLPESEKDNQIMELEKKAAGFDRLFEELLKARKNHPTKK